MIIFALQLPTLSISTYLSDKDIFVVENVNISFNENPLSFFLLLLRMLQYSEDLHPNEADVQLTMPSLPAGGRITELRQRLKTSIEQAEDSKKREDAGKHMRN